MAVQANPSPPTTAAAAATAADRHGRLEEESAQQEVQQQLKDVGVALESCLSRLQPLLDCKRREGRLGVPQAEADVLFADALVVVARHSWHERPWSALKPRALLLQATVLYLTVAAARDVQRLLHQVVKLCPRACEAWNLLAHCCWETGDLGMARCCLTSGLRHAPNKEGLQQLSMVVRQGSFASAPDRTEALALSIQAAKAAVQLDVHDGYSWYVLAMAHMSSYFLSEQSPRSASGRPRELAYLLAAFARAEAGCGGSLADVHYNRAALHTYCQDFQAALQDYERAAAADARLPCAQQVGSIVSLLEQLSSLVLSRGGIKPKQWAKVQALLARDMTKGAEMLPRLHYEPLKLVKWVELVPGVNQGSALLCRPLVFLAPPLNASATLYLVCVGAGGGCFVLALVRMSHDAIGMTQLLTVVHPHLQHAAVSWQHKEYCFPMIKVDCSTVLVDGIPLAQDLAPQGLLRNTVMAT